MIKEKIKEHMMEKLSKREANKLLKKENLLKAAYQLFIEQGIQNTSVSDIVKLAGVAKGTFYLYFKDKTDIEEQLIAKETGKIMTQAIQMARQSDKTTFEDQFLVAVDYIIDYLEKSRDVLSFINKNLSYAIYVLTKDQESEVRIKSFFNRLYEQYKDEVTVITIDNPDLVISLSIEFLGATIYSSLSINKPKPIDELRPHIHKCIKAIFSAYRK